MSRGNSVEDLVDQFREMMRKIHASGATGTLHVKLKVCRGGVSENVILDFEQQVKLKSLCSEINLLMLENNLE